MIPEEEKHEPPLKHVKYSEKHCNSNSGEHESLNKQIRSIMTSVINS